MVNLKSTLFQRWILWMNERWQIDVESTWLSGWTTSRRCFNIYQRWINIESLLGESRCFKVDVFIPGATSGDIVDKTDDILEGKRESLIVHLGMNDLINNVNLLNSIKKMLIKSKTPPPILRYVSQIFLGETKEI